MAKIQNKDSDSINDVGQKVGVQDNMSQVLRDLELLGG